MRCPSCGVESPSEARFCMGCGTSLVGRCAACGHANPPEARFCMQCGGRLAGVAPTAGLAEHAPSAPSREDIPRHLVEKILASRAALEGERKQITVLFADIVGSTELIRDRDPEEAQALLDGVVTRMMDAVHRYEGTVDRLLGDGLMALFGAPIAHEDHALRACYAALALQDAVRAYAEETLRDHGVAIQARVGLNSGEVVVRVISDDLHMDYTALGQTVHLAARLEQVAEPGGIRLSAETLRLVEGYVEARSLGAVPMKGLDGPVEVHDLLGAGAARTRLEAAASRGLTRFVGRRAQLQAIEAAMAGARDGHGQVVALIGEPGVGKSRLVREVVGSPAAEGWAVLEAGAVSYGTTTPYLPIVGLLRSWCSAVPSDDPAAVGQKLVGGLRALDPALEAMRSPLLALLDAPVDDAEWRELDPGQRRRRMLDAVKRLLLRVSQDRPLLLVVEDLHWIDSETQALLDDLVDSLPAARILLLVNYRPEYVHAWGNRGHYVQLRLDPLGQVGADDLLAALLGEDAALADLKRLLIERTGGNPFFLEEAVRSLVEVGLLVGERGAYRLTGPADAVRVPATVQAVLAARIDRLAPEEKRLVQTASVVGKDVPYAVLAAVAGLPDDRLRDGLGRLQATEFLVEVAFFPEPEYTFRHALTHDVAYGGLLQERRRELHGRVVEAIEALYANRLDEHVERLAHHAARAESWGRAVNYQRRAGHRAHGRSANREAAARFEQALLALRQLLPSQENLELAIDLRLELRPALVPLGEFGRIGDLLREATDIAERLEDQRRLALVLAFMTNYHVWMGEPERAMAAGQRALAIGQTVGDLAIQVVASNLLGNAYAECGVYRLAIESYGRTIDLVGDELRHERFGLVSPPADDARQRMVWCMGEIGQFTEGAARGAEAVQDAKAHDHPYALASALTFTGRLHLSKGDLSEAVSALEQALDLCRTWELPSIAILASSSLGAAYSVAGRIAEAVPLLERTIEQGERMAATGQSRQVAHLGQAYLFAHRLDQAIQAAERAIELALRHQERGHLAWALWLRGEIAARGNPLPSPDAETRYHEALDLAKVLEMRPLQAQCHLGLGKLYRRTGRPDEASAELRTAVAMLREMGMAFWLPEAEHAAAGGSVAPSAM